MHQFTLWKHLNMNKRVMKMPGEHVALALTLMEGPTVDNWVMQQTQKLIKKVDGMPGDGPAHGEYDEDVWTEFADEFRATFMDSASKEKAFSKLGALTMEHY
jgi:hypothetical protein